MDNHTDISLDEPELYQRLDPSGLRERIADLPYQCLHAWEEGLRFSLPSSYRKARNVILAGVGGSAIGGELMGDLITRDGSPLVTVCRDYHLPPYLGPDSLVIVSSYSGNTEETIAAFQDAIERKAKVVVVTTGGRLLQMAQKEGVPAFQIDYVGEPRTALGYSFLVPLAMLQSLELTSNNNESVVEASEVLFSPEPSSGDRYAHPRQPGQRACQDPAGEADCDLRWGYVVRGGPTVEDPVQRERQGVGLY